MAYSSGTKNIYNIQNKEKYGMHQLVPYCNMFSKNNNRGRVLLKSNLERAFARICDTNPAILRWQYEPFCINYYSSQQAKTRKYHTDFFIQKVENGIPVLKVIEIKPKSQTIAAKRITKSNEADIILNTEKWLEMIKVCNAKGWVFEVLCEDTLIPKKK